MSTTTPIDLAGLRALCQAATPGPWVWDWGDGSLPELRMEEFDGTDPTVLGAYVCKTCLKDGSKCLAPNEHNAAFIAAANPRTVLALLDRLAAAEALIAHLGVCAICAESDAAECCIGRPLQIAYDRAIASQQEGDA